MSKWTMEDLLRLMCESEASDLLLTAGTWPQLRVNGILQPVGPESMDAETTRALAFSLLTEPQIALLKERKSLDLSRGYEGLSRFRINIFFQRDSVALAVRRIPFVIPSFEELGVPPLVADFASRPHGLVLITGPAGSGKSTTMAAMIDFINRTRHVHIVCIEDPIEYLHQHHKSVVAQREVHVDARSFADAMHSVFRQSPDVIMVGEMRDLETVSLALTLAETGHLILATLHTQDTTHAINRIVDMYPSSQQTQIYSQIALVLVGVISQQLIITRDGRRRVLAHETLNVNNAIRNLIREMQIQQVYSVIQTGRREGMVTMNDSLRSLVEGGWVDPAMALRRSPRPKELARMLSIPLPVELADAV